MCVCVFTAQTNTVKGHRQRISTVGYKTIFRTINTQGTFLPFTVITNKDYFSRNLRNLLSYCRGICDFVSMEVVTSLVTIAILIVNIVYLL